MSALQSLENGGITQSTKIDPSTKIKKALSAAEIPTTTPAKAPSPKTGTIRDSLNFTPITVDLFRQRSVVRIKLHRHGSSNTQESVIASKPLPQTPTPVQQGNNAEASARTSNETVERDVFTVHTHSLKQLYEDAAATIEPDGQLTKARCLLNELQRTENSNDDIEELTIAVTRLIKRLAASHGVNKPGYSPAQLYLGNCYGEGAFNFEKSASKAFYLYWLGSKQNHPECTYRVAICHQLGAGTTKNMLQATHYLHKSARLGFVPAMYKLGMMMLSRDGRERRQGVSWLKRAVRCDPETPEPVVLHTLAAAYETPGYALVPDLGYASQLYHAAADLGYSPSQYRLAVAYETGNLGCKVDEEQALAWAKKAASQGEPDAEFFLSRWYLSKNPDMAYHWADRAACKGNVRAMLAMAYYKEYGIGTEKDFDEAKRWLKLAAANDDALAVRRIRELKKEDSTSSFRESCNIM